MKYKKNVPRILYFHEIRSGRVPIRSEKQKISFAYGIQKKLYLVINNGRHLRPRAKNTNFAWK
jgi:hypothetical protein